MEARDSLGLQMQAFYEHLRAGAGAFPPHQPSPLHQQQPSPHHQQQQEHHHLLQQHHLHQQQQQQQQQQHHHQQQQQHQQQHQQQQQQQQHYHQQNANRNSLNPSIIHSPAPLRQINPNPNLNPGPNLKPNSSSGVSQCYPPETPPHMMPHQLQAASSSPPSGVGMSMSPGSAMVPRSAPVFKKKRGRPRKYATDGNGDAALVIPISSAPPAEKKGGRGPGKKSQISTSGATGQGFTPHVLTVGAGEDITAKIMTFSQHGPWAVCILSANGAISNASLWHGGVSSGTVTYEGRFEILSLSGLFLLTEDGGTRSRSGGFSVSLAGQDGRVIGGRVAGLLIAATPIQVVVGTFFPESRKSQARAGNVEGSSHTPPTVGTRQPSVPMMDRTHVDDSGPAQDHISGPPARAVKEEHRASHVMPLQSADWGASDFDMETRCHSEQM